MQDLRMGHVDTKIFESYWTEFKGQVWLSESRINWETLFFSI